MGESLIASLRDTKERIEGQVIVKENLNKEWCTVDRSRSCPKFKPRFGLWPRIVLSPTATLALLSAAWKAWQDVVVDENLNYSVHLCCIFYRKLSCGRYFN